LQFEETDKELTMMVKPRFVPPGFPRYQEYYDKTQKEEKTWALRRDLKTGRSYGRIFFAADGTIIFRYGGLLLFFCFFVERCVMGVACVATAASAQYARHAGTSDTTASA
jgi:hypothetical protein